MQLLPRRQSLQILRQHLKWLHLCLRNLWRRHRSHQVFKRHCLTPLHLLLQHHQYLQDLREPRQLLLWNHRLNQCLRLHSVHQHLHKHLHHHLHQHLHKHLHYHLHQHLHQQPHQYLRNHLHQHLHLHRIELWNWLAYKHWCSNKNFEKRRFRPPPPVRGQLPGLIGQPTAKKACVWSDWWRSRVKANDTHTCRSFLLAARKQLTSNLLFSFLFFWGGGCTNISKHICWLKN